MTTSNSDERWDHIAARFVRTTYGRQSRRARFTGVIIAVVLLGSVVTLVALWRSTPDVEQTTPVATGVHLTAAQRAAGGIIIEALRPVSLPQILRAPGEVRTNDYITAVVAPRISATVVSRHARLGDVVRKGQSLVTLYSRDMAEAQSGFVLAERDLARYRRLNATASIAGQLLDQATAKRQELFGRLESFGLTPLQVGELTAKGLSNSATGQFELVAPQNGTITKDAFREGDVADIGKLLFEITDPKNVWVEAHVSPPLARTISGQTALVVAGDQTRAAHILQISDTVDETTRTITVRLAVDNGDAVLKPGQFVDVELYGSAEPVLAVPTAAVLRSADGDWVVYVENKDGLLRARQVQIRYAVGDRTAISGIEPGTRVVTVGAFFVHSEAQKSNFESDD